MFGAPLPPASPGKVFHQPWAPSLCHDIQSLISISTNTVFELIYQVLRHLTNIPTSHRNTHSSAPLKSNPFPNTDGWPANSLVIDAVWELPSWRPPRAACTHQKARAGAPGLCGVLLPPQPQLPATSTHLCPFL